MATNNSTSTTNAINGDSKPLHLRAGETESKYNRNPYPDFKALEASRPDFTTPSTLTFHKTPAPNWKLGSGANHLASSPSSSRSQHPSSDSKGEPADKVEKAKEEEEEEHVEIDPYAKGRPATSNYKLLISAIAPRPIALVSTLSASGTPNLAPFSFFSIISHDPPLFSISITGSLEPSRQKDTLRNLLSTRECTINIISEHYIEAANATAINSPYEINEFRVAGLTEGDCTEVKAKRVKEAVFSVEARLESVREFESRVTVGKKTSVLVIVEGVRFWVRGDALVGGKNGSKERVDPDVLRPISRFGGISYGRTTEMIELTRWDWLQHVEGDEEARRLVGLD